MVCALASLPGSGGCQDPRLFVYSAGRNGPLTMDFSADLTAPRVVCWDLSDPRLLAVQTGALVRSQGGGNSSSRPNSGETCSTAAAGAQAPSAPAGKATTAAAAGGELLLARSSDVATVFATDEAGLLLQEYQGLDGSAGFLGIRAPHLLLVKKSATCNSSGPAFDQNSTGSSSFAQVPLRCFSGLSSVDDATRRALMDFNYLLAVGRLDEAFRVVSSLKNPALWRNMAHMAIKNKQLAVAGRHSRSCKHRKLCTHQRSHSSATDPLRSCFCHTEHCLGNMQHIRGARALRQSAAAPELDARVGLVAVQLGLTDEAARLFSTCERWDLLQELHAASGSWQDALQVADKQDRCGIRHACMQQPCLAACLCC